MSDAPEECMYCDKGRNRTSGQECGFCDNGKPLDTQKDWDRSWGAFLPGLED